MDVNLPLLTLYRHSVSGKLLNAFCINFSCKVVITYIAGASKHTLCYVHVAEEKCSIKQILQMSRKGSGTVDYNLRLERSK